VPNPSIDITGMVRNLAIVSVGNIIGGLVFVVGGYLAAAKTDAVLAAK
jgi:formate/nitrite transporter FocA (FNT family)